MGNLKPSDLLVSWYKGEGLMEVMEMTPGMVIHAGHPNTWEIDARLSSATQNSRPAWAVCDLVLKKKMFQ